MASRDVKDLVPPALELYFMFDKAMKEAGLNYIITCVKRTKAEQGALYVQGREPLEIVNKLRKIAELPPITEKENKIVTWTRKSRHFAIQDYDELGKLHPDWIGKCLAFDIAIISKNRKPVWDLKTDIDEDGIPDYLEASKIAKQVGFISGADFSNPDYPHIEYREA